MNISKRSAADVVVIILAGVVAVLLIVAVIGSVILKIIHPGIDLSNVSEVVTNTLGTIVGALVGFIGGRAYGKSETNGGGAKE